MHDQADQIHDRSRHTGDYGQLLLAILSGKFRRKRGTDHKHRSSSCQGGHGLRSRIAIIVREHIACHTLHRQHREQKCNRRGYDAEQRTVCDKASQQLSDIQFCIVCRNLHALSHQLKAEQIADDREHAKHTCDERHAGTGQHCVSIHHLIGKHWRTHTDHQPGKRCTDRSPCGQVRAVFRIRRDCRRHGTIRDVDRCIEYGTPQYIGGSHPEHLETIWHVCESRLIDQEGSDRYRSAHALDPRFELAVLCRLGAIDDLPHRHVGKGIDKPRRHHQQSHDCRADPHHVRVELQHKTRGQNKCKIISKITKHVTQFVSHAKRGH